LRARNASLATIETYEQSFITFRLFLQAAGVSQELTDLTSDVVRAYQIWLRETPLPRIYKGTTVRSIGGVHTKVRQLRALVRFGEAEGMITH
jgi:site-specific recombinase XerD